MSTLPEQIASRAVADSRDRPAWLRRRRRAIGGSDAANFARAESVPRYIASKLHNGFDGNAWTQHGNTRERAILAAYRIEQNTTMFRSVPTSRHVATPDGIHVLPDGEVILAQVKALTHSPMTRNGLGPKYLRQCWWEQYVLGASRTLFVWEHHEGFRPTRFEPESVWIDRDEAAIAQLVRIANAVLVGMDEHDQFGREMEGQR